MTEQQFYKKIKGINSPKYRGAKMPKFNPAMINVSEFADELRLKAFDTNFIEGVDSPDTVVINWTSQEWDPDGVDDVVDEIHRCFKHIGFVGNVVLDIWMRGEKGSVNYEDHREFTVE